MALWEGLWGGLWKTSETPLKTLPLRDPLRGRFPSQNLSGLLPLIVLPLNLFRDFETLETVSKMWWTALGAQASGDSLFRDSGLQAKFKGSSLRDERETSATWSHVLLEALLRMATKEYLNQRGTKIRVFRVPFRAPFLPPLFPHFSTLFPLQALFTLPPLLPSSPPPLSPLFWLPEISDLGTPLI